MIYAVTGLPRCGTSMMMRMLEVGGLPVIFDNSRSADKHNPNGYYEATEFLEMTDLGLRGLHLAENKAIKVLLSGMLRWPSDKPCKVIIMQRDAWEMTQSLRIMRRDEMMQDDLHWALIPDDNGLVFTTDYANRSVSKLKTKSNLDILEVNYNILARDPLAAATEVRDHFSLPLNIERMATVWSNDLYRNRAIEAQQHA